MTKPQNRSDLNIINLSVDDVRKAYRGKQGCMCGCNGTYYYHQNEPREDWQGNVSHRGIQSVIKTMQDNALEVYRYDPNPLSPGCKERMIAEDSGSIPVDCPFICYDYETSTGVKMTCVLYLKADL